MLFYKMKTFVKCSIVNTVKLLINNLSRFYCVIEFNVG